MDMLADAYANALPLRRSMLAVSNRQHPRRFRLAARPVLCPSLDNHRTDEYSGSIENRARFPLMVVDRIRKKCGSKPHH